MNVLHPVFSPFCIDNPRKDTTYLLVSCDFLAIINDPYNVSYETIIVLLEGSNPDIKTIEGHPEDILNLVNVFYKARGAKARLRIRFHDETLYFK